MASFSDAALAKQGASLSFALAPCKYPPAEAARLGAAALGGPSPLAALGPAAGSGRGVLAAGSQGEARAHARSVFGVRFSNHRAPVARRNG